MWNVNRRNKKVLQYFVIYQKLCSPWVNMSVLGSSINLQQNPPNLSISSDLISQQGVLDTCNTCWGGTNIFKIRYLQHHSSAYPDFSLLINGERARVNILFQHDLYVILTNELQNLPQQKKANLILCARFKNYWNIFWTLCEHTWNKNKNMQWLRTIFEKIVGIFDSS